MNGKYEIEWASRKASKAYESIELEKHCYENMTGLQSFHKQEPKIKNKKCKEIKFEGEKYAICIGLLRENFE